jgi:hypothetical protein
MAPNDLPQRSMLTDNIQKRVFLVRRVTGVRLPRCLLLMTRSLTGGRMCGRHHHQRENIVSDYVFCRLHGGESILIVRAASFGTEILACSTRRDRHTDGVFAGW